MKTTTNIATTPTKPLLTVLVPTYNQEKTISRTLESIIEQKTEYLFSVVVADDCSTDRTREICETYVKKYPKIIQLKSQPINTKAHHVTQELQEIKTKYLTVLEGDDYWCNEGKIQIALDFLEQHSEYVTFAHDTLHNNMNTGKTESLVHDIYGLEKVDNPVGFDNYLYLHTSARVYRNCVDLSEYFPKGSLTGDIHVLFLYLNKGPLYYYDKIMSVYNISGKGEWSKLSHRQKLAAEEEVNYFCNRLLRYEQDDFFSSRVPNKNILLKLKNIFGKRLGWMVYANFRRMRRIMK